MSGDYWLVMRRKSVIFQCGSSTILKLCSTPSIEAARALSPKMNFGLNEYWKLDNNLSSLRLFFTAFLDVGTLGEEKISSITEESYAAMTSNGDVKLDYHIYKLSFLNFLIGKQPNGPGQYIFGSVVPKVSWNLLNNILTSAEVSQVASKFSLEGF